VHPFGGVGVVIVLAGQMQQPVRDVEHELGRRLDAATLGLTTCGYLHQSKM
jgi:hypothetical protein